MAQYSSSSLPQGSNGMDEEMYIAGTQYFALNDQVYGFNQIYGLLFPVNETCAPLNPITSVPGTGIGIRLCNIVLRTTECGGLDWWESNSGRWESIRLFSSYGDVFSFPLLGSIYGINLEPQFALECDVGREQNIGQVQEDMEELFYSYGNPPTWDSINRWIEDGKLHRAPTVNICPLKNCGKELRRPHAVKDHLCFKFGIKAFQCGYDGCGKLFATKTNCDRHMKDSPGGRNGEQLERKWMTLG
ncbi:unnamed protein product [Rhizoctonia solani]|uniref:C2H2-type domain-containing protein n=1 Tax=Rhizoctonia solani TaxID=456999 RepID=A0A8H3AA41_9AGAM|nr:unnamed protein product [Rhizoctonia solani]